MSEPLKKEDMIRGIIVNADEYKSDDIISPVKIEEVWINLENHKSAVEWLKGVIKPLSFGKINRYEVIEAIDTAFPTKKS